MKDRKRNILSFAAALLGVVFMAFGVYRGELSVMFIKAIKICLECIGIG